MNSPKSEGQPPRGKSKNGARSHTVQVGTVKRAGLRSGIGKVALGIESLGVLKHAIKRTQRIYQGIWKPELELLVSASLYLMVVKDTGYTFPKDDMIRWMGFRLAKPMRRSAERLEKLADKGYLLRVDYNRGTYGYGFAISEKGGMVLKVFEEEFEKCNEWAATRLKRIDRVILYLDKADQVLNGAQRIRQTSEISDKLRSITV